ncbi:polysaccharide lyase family 1 protein [Macrolepiota fuliginosa MF-IS2]|uniref:pectate lyase n=1 Tax=Macrolepiota fuliginosa MF-IS2 TaxID=1400762 RepID=A0A9P6C3T4_9AGAR|nr:polysaccharide lyase family 1 protein [Macrolepiota fuliginosa MF-IS2]
MRFFASVIAFTAIQVASAGLIQKRASVDDVATVGYATLNGGTTGGSGGTQTTVSTLDALTAAVSGSDKKVVIISGVITGSAVVKVGSNTSIIGKAGSALDGIGLRVIEESNVIIRNVKISKVLAEVGDAIGIQAAHQIWVDHVDLSSDRDHDKDYYDGLLDITHGSTGVTITDSKIYTHWKASLVGHSDSNGDEDTPITVTYAGNNWYDLNSRTPSFRFGHGHIYNNVFDNNNDGINTRDGAQLLVENNVWTGTCTTQPLYSTDGGFAVARGNDFGGAENTAPAGDFSTAPYSYNLLDTTSVRASVTSNAGQTLSL